MSLTVNDIVEFVTSHDGFKDVFRQWTKEQLALETYRAFNEGRAAYEVDAGGNISGFVLANKNAETHTLHIVGIIGRVHSYRDILLRDYAGWNVTGWRTKGNNQRILVNYGKRFTTTAAK